MEICLDRSEMADPGSSQEKESGSHFLLHILCSYCALSVFKRASFILHTRKEKSLATVPVIGHNIDDTNHICPLPKSGALSHFFGPFSQTGSYLCQVVPIWGSVALPELTYYPLGGLCPQREITWKQFGASMEFHPFRQAAIHKTLLPQALMRLSNHWTSRSPWNRGH